MLSEVRTCLMCHVKGRDHEFSQYQILRYQIVVLISVTEFSPIKLRIGGSLQDKVIYGVDDPEIKCVPFEKNGSQMFGFTEGCLSMSRWDELNKFFQKTGAIVTFGLNALNGRIHLKDGSSKGPWDSENAAAFIKYTVNKGYTVHGWELGQNALYLSRHLWYQTIKYIYVVSV